MYVKAICTNGIWKTETGKVLGREVGHILGSRLVLENENGDQRIALYGTRNQEEEFVEFCTLTTCPRCIGKEKESCRYNRKNQEQAGYYVFE